MAPAILYCTFVLLLYLQGNYAQQGLPNNQNVGVNNGIGFQQQALQRTNTPNNINQLPNGGLNINLPQQSNLQQGNLQQPICANFQGNLPQSLGLQGNSQPQGGSGSIGNVQFNKQGLPQLPGIVINPSPSQTGPMQLSNGCRQNQMIEPQSNMGAQMQNLPFSSNSLAELAALKGYPSLLSFLTSQYNGVPQQSQQMANLNPAQDQLTDVQKQFLIRALQSQTSQPQLGANLAQTDFRVIGDNRPTVTIQGTPQQAIVTPVANQPPYITVQAQPLTSYLQNHQQQVVEDPSMMSLILSGLQPSNPQYPNSIPTVYQPYPTQPKESKSSLKSLIPLIINLLKEKNNCGCQNCGCPDNGCGNNNTPEPTIFGGYSNQKNYGSGAVETPKKSKVEEPKSKSTKEKNNVKKNVVKVDSEEASDENDSEYTDSEEY